MISFESLGVAYLDQPQTLKFLSHKLANTYQRFIFLFLQVLQERISLFEQSIESRHNSNRYQTKIRRGIEEATHSSHQKANPSNSHKHNLTRKLTHRFDISDKMMNTSLSLLIVPVKLTIQYVVVENCSKSDTDFVRNIKKLISPKICKNAKRTKNTSPLAYLHRIHLQQLWLRNAVDVQGHKRIDVIVDIGKIHERSSMQDGNASTVYVFFYFRFADVP